MKTTIIMLAISFVVLLAHQDIWHMLARGRKCEWTFRQAAYNTAAMFYVGLLMGWVIWGFKP